jgi:hypothetical protein
MTLGGKGLSSFHQVLRDGTTMRSVVVVVVVFQCHHMSVTDFVVSLLVVGEV